MLEQFVANEMLIKTKLFVENISENWCILFFLFSWLTLNHFFSKVHIYSVECLQSKANQKWMSEHNCSLNTNFLIALFFSLNCCSEVWFVAKFNETFWFCCKYNNIEKSLWSGEKNVLWNFPALADEIWDGRKCFGQNASLQSFRGCYCDTVEASEQKKELLFCLCGLFICHWPQGMILLWKMPHLCRSTVVQYISHSHYYRCNVLEHWVNRLKTLIVTHTFQNLFSYLSENRHGFFSLVKNKCLENMLFMLFLFLFSQIYISNLHIQVTSKRLFIYSNKFACFLHFNHVIGLPANCFETVGDQMTEKKEITKKEMSKLKRFNFFFELDQTGNWFS